jgi:hypothetical protein
VTRARICGKKAVGIKPWTARELEELRRLAPLGARVAAAALGRSVASVQKAAARHRISLRRAGERRGLVLGQPRGTRATGELAALRAAVLQGLVDAAEVEARGASALRGSALCPGCASRPPEVSSTGFCRPCHLRALARGLEHARAETAARREWDAARQRRHRGSG